MPKKQYQIKLSYKQRESLSAISRREKCSAAKKRRANVLLLSDEGDYGEAWIDSDVAKATGLSVRSIEIIRKQFVEEGLERTVERKVRKDPPRSSKITGKVEAMVAKIACSKAPLGQEHWTLRLLASRLIELEIVDSISHETVRHILKKTLLNRGKNNVGAFPQNKTQHS